MSWGVTSFFLAGPGLGKFLLLHLGVRVVVCHPGAVRLCQGSQIHCASAHWNQVAMKGRAGASRQHPRERENAPSTSALGAAPRAMTKLSVSKGERRRWQGIRKPHLVEQFCLALLCFPPCNCKSLQLLSLIHSFSR